MKMRIRLSLWLIRIWLRNKDGRGLGISDGPGYSL